MTNMILRGPYLYSIARCRMRLMNYLGLIKKVEPMMDSTFIDVYDVVSADIYSASRSFISSTAEYVTGVPGPKMAATPAL